MGGSNAAQYIVNVDDINAMVDKYTANLPSGEHLRSLRSLTGETVFVLTGCTGNVGIHILASFLADSRIDTIYALNRPSASLSPLDRLKASFAQRDLPL